MPKYVYDFSEGNKDLKDLLGGKGANLAEMTNLGLPVPPGFTITTEACTTFLTTGSEPPELADEVSRHLAAMEKAIGRRLGDPDDPHVILPRPMTAVSGARRNRIARERGRGGRPAPGPAQWNSFGANSLR